MWLRIVCLNWGRKALVVVLLSFFSVSLCWSSSDVKSSEWNKKMQEMEHAVNKLVPYTYSYMAFHDLSNQTKIQGLIDGLSRVIHELPDDQREPLTGRDPLMNASLVGLNKDLERASAIFKAGNTEHARALVQGAVDHCFHCHTRADIGPEYFSSAMDYKAVKLSLSEQVDLQVATRQYDAALSLLEQGLGNKGSIFNEEFEVERAIKKYLAIVLRVKRQPDRGIALIDQVLENSNLPIYLMEDLHQWKASLLEGQKVTVGNQTLQSAKALINQGRALQAEFGSQKGYIEYLLGSSMMHGLLTSKELSDLEYSDVYLALGQSYELISSLGLWELPTNYYEACIRQTPGSDIAQQCYKFYERHTVLSYTGSRGTYLPIDERERLNELCKLSGVKSRCYGSS